MTKEVLMYLISKGIAYAHVREEESGKLFNVKISKKVYDIDFKIKTHIVMNQTKELSKHTLEYWDDSIWYFDDLLSATNDYTSWDVKFSHEPTYEEAYILVCPKHTKLDNGKWLLWGEDEKGYTFRVDECGLYYEDWIRRESRYEIIDDSNFGDVRTELNKTLFYDGRRKDNGRYEGTSFAIKYKDMERLLHYPMCKSFSF